MLAVVSAAAVPVVAAGLWAAPGSGGTGSAAMATGTTTAAVERRDLVLTDDYDGELGYGEASSITANRSGVVTSVPEGGTVVKPSETLFTIDLQPTVLLKGAVPAFRTLDVDADPGADVAQLEQALVDLGFGGKVTVDDDFTSATADAVEAWEESLGRFDPDGVVEFGDVVFASGEVRIAEVTSDTGTQVREDSEVVTASPTTKVVTMSVNADAASRLEAGTAVGLELSDGTATSGQISDVGAETAAAGGPGGSSVTVTMALDDPSVADDVEGGSVDVTVERSRVKNPVVVPVTALLALTEGGYGVQLVDRSQPGGSRLVSVEVGTYSDDWVQVTGRGVEPGARVVVPR